MNSALKRARAGLRQGLPSAATPPTPGSPAEQVLVDRFVRAYQSGDVDGLVALLTEDVTISMPPVPLEYQGAVIDPWGNERIGFEGSVVVNRKDWGLTWNAAIESGGVLVSEKVTLEFEISAVKQA